MNLKNRLINYKKKYNANKKKLINSKMIFKIKKWNLRNN